MPKTETAPVETLRTLFDYDPCEWLEGFTAFREDGAWRAADRPYANGWTNISGTGCGGRSGAGVGRRPLRGQQRVLRRPSDGSLRSRCNFLKGRPSPAVVGSVPAWARRRPDPDPPGHPGAHARSLEWITPDGSAVWGGIGPRSVLNLVGVHQSGVPKAAAIWWVSSKASLPEGVFPHLPLATDVVHCATSVRNAGGRVMQIANYRLIKKIGTGAFSEVWVAEHCNFPRKAAIKILKEHMEPGSEAEKLFLREGEVLSGFDQTNIVRIFDSAQLHGKAYLVMEYLEGGTLADLLNNGPLSVCEALGHTMQIADALDTAHGKGVIHRDIKPANILLRDAQTPVLNDFGTSRLLLRSTIFGKDGGIVGTPQYMSPEQAQGLDLDGKSDLYSLGVLFHELILGKVPYNAPEAMAVLWMHIKNPLPRLPDNLLALQPLLDGLLAKSPDERFKNGAHFIAEAREVVGKNGGVSRLIQECLTPEWEKKFANYGIFRSALKGGSHVAPIALHDLHGHTKAPDVTIPAVTGKWVLPSTSRFIRLFVIIAVVLASLAIALPVYQDYIARSQVSEAIAGAGATKTAISEYLAALGEMPDAKRFEDLQGGRYSRIVTHNAEGVISVEMRANEPVSSVVRGLVVTLTPVCQSSTGSDKIITAWTCSTTTTHSKYLPRGCVEEFSPTNC